MAEVLLKRFLLPQLCGISRSLLASKLQHSAHRPHSVELPAWNSQRLPWQGSPERRHFKTGQLFSCYGWKQNSMRSAFHQHRLSVSWQDLLMSYKVWQLKLSQEASLRWECLLALANRTDLRNCCYQQNMLYSILSPAFSGFLWMQLSTRVPFCNMVSCWLGFLSFPIPTAGNPQRNYTETIFF